eukprot:jgi/Chlat1/36/ChrspC233139S00917
MSSGAGACPTEDSNGALCVTGDASNPNSQCYCFPFIDAATGVYTLDAGQQFTWNSGQRHCESIGGTLAQMFSLAERNTIVKKIAPYISAWIGLSRSADIDADEWDALPCPPTTEARCTARVDLFKWGGTDTPGTGTIPQTYQDWLFDFENMYEPDNSDPSREEFCVVMIAYDEPAHPGTWDDDICTNKFPIICSVPQIGGPSLSPPLPAPPTSSPSPTPSPPPPVQTPSPPAPQSAVTFKSTDIAATTPGTTTYTPSTGVWQIANCGENMWDVEDSFRYVHDAATHAGNVTITATVLTQDLANFPATKSALVLRSNLTPGKWSPAVEIIVGQTWEAATSVFVQYRAMQDGTTEDFDFPALDSPSLPVWLQISRTGNTIQASASLDGESWTVIYSFAPPAGSALLSPVFVGMGVCSVTYGESCTPSLATSTFSNVSVN